MNSIKYISTLLFVLFSSIVFGQTTLIGKVTNNKAEPIVNAIVYLDSIQTNSKTNSIGFFEVQVPKETKEITLFAPEYGYLTYKYNNEKRLNIIFNKPKTETKNIVKNDNYSANSLNVKNDKNAY